MSAVKKILRGFFRIFRNKYTLTLFVFFIWMLFFDNNNLIDQVSNIYQLRQLKKDKEYYLEKIKDDKRKLNELQTNNENLEKFAREQYLMKKDSEDVFILVKDGEKEDEENQFIK